MNTLPLAEPDEAAVKRFWSRPRVLAAQLIAEAELTNKQIAARIKKSEQWLYESKRSPLFQARVKELVDELAEDARRFGIANQRIRLEEQDARWQAMIEIREQRRKEYGDRYDGVPGVHTGLMRPVAKMVKVYNTDTDPEEALTFGDTEALFSAKQERMVYEWEEDTALLADQRQLEKQVAAELGQSAANAKGDGDTNIYGGQVLIIRDVPRLGV